jgi:hypothetical protein
MIVHAYTVVPLQLSIGYKPINYRYIMIYHQQKPELLELCSPTERYLGGTK